MGQCGTSVTVLVGQCGTGVTGWYWCDRVVLV